MIDSTMSQSGAPSPPVILVSNDDGHQAAGIQALAGAMAGLGEVWVVAPEAEQSASSHAISIHRPLRIREVRPRWYAVDGTPTDCSYVGINHVLKDRRPWLLVSGINHGPNLAAQVLLDRRERVPARGHPGQRLQRGAAGGAGVRDPAPPRPHARRHAPRRHGVAAAGLRAALDAAMAPVLILLHGPSEPLGALAPPLAAAGLALDTRLAPEPLPSNLAGYGGIVVMGGAMGVYEADRHPFLTGEIRLLRVALERGIPVLGVCLGSQLLAAAGGARVYRGEAGPEVGWLPVTRLADDPWLEGWPRSFEPLSW